MIYWHKFHYMGISRNKYQIGFWLYIIFWSLYFLQGALFGEGSMASQSILIILLSWSFIIFFKCNSAYHFPSSMKAIEWLLMSYIIYGIIPIINGTELRISFSGQIISSYAYIKVALVSIIPIFVFFYYTKKNVISTETLCILSYLFFIVIVITFYANETKLLRLAIERNSTVTEFTNNVSYSFIFLIPYLYLFKKKARALILLLGISVFLLMSMKRGAIILGVVVIFGFLYRILADAPVKKKVGVLMATIVFFVLMSNYIADMYENSPYFQSRIEKTLEGNTSERDVILSSLMNYYLNETNIWQFLLGSGASATSEHAINVAHNDWVELLVDEGLVGFILLLAFFIYFFKDVQKMRRYSHQYYYMFLTIFIIVFLRTFFSMSICDMQPYLTLPFGFLLAKLSSYECKKSK